MKDKILIPGNVNPVDGNAVVKADDLVDEIIRLKKALGRETERRRKVEKTLEEERKRFNDVLELLPVYTILLSPDYKVPYANRFFRERFGNSDGKKCFEYLFNRTEPCEVCETYRTLRENKPLTWEWVGPDNHVYSIYDFPFKDSDGSTMIMEVGIDVTSLKNAQSDLMRLNSELESRVAERTRELASSNERLSILSETSSRLLESGNPQELVNELCNRVMKYLDCQVFFNYLIDEGSGKLLLNSYAGVQPGTAARIKWLEMGEAVCGSVALEGKRIIAENINDSGDSRTTLVKSLGVRAYACHPLMSGETVLGTLSFGTKTRTGFSDDDISMMKTVADEVAIAISRVRYENAIQASGDKLKLALENGNIGTWELHLKTNKMDLDERMEKIFGFDPGTFRGTFAAFEKCLSEDDLPHVRKSICDALEKGVPFETVYRIKKKDSFNYISSKASVVRDDNNRPVKISGVCLDITDMKKGAQRVLLKLNEDLLRSNHELEQFAAVASHDLQEPLRMISSFTQLLGMRYADKLDSDARDFIKYAVDGAARMQNLINDLLAFSKIETRAGQLTLVDMNRPLKHALNNLKVTIHEKKGVVTNSELPRVMADEGQMVQLFQNLVGNAMKFCETKPEVHISSAENYDHFLFSVKDNGIGIEKQYYEKIFKIFQRLMPRDQYDGTGIGLAICRRIVERHGGKIWVESSPGFGSEFMFTLPKTNFDHTEEKPEKIF